MGLPLQFSNYLSSFRKSSCLGLGEYQLVVHDNIKDAIAPWNELGLHAEGIMQFIRQTGGVAFIVSFCAIMNINIHSVSPISSLG